MSPLQASLKELRILNTRPQKPGQLLSSAIRQYGGIAIELPTLDIKACNTKWRKDLPDLTKVNYALFISANAVDYCFPLLAQYNIEWPQNIKVIAIGPGTVGALKHYQIKVDEIPSIPDSEHLLALPCLQEVEQKLILLFKGEGGRTVIEDELRKRHAQLIILPVYKRTRPNFDFQFTNSIWRDNAVDIILVTSEQSILNLFKLFSAEAHSWLQNKPFLVISERLAQAASLMGIKKITISHPNRIINSLFDYKDSMHGYEQ
jgi:uroporphyrinogen-III synthase